LLDQSSYVFRSRYSRVNSPDEKGPIAVYDANPASKNWVFNVVEDPWTGNKALQLDL
jgi:hypothetical protein